MTETIEHHTGTGLPEAHEFWTRGDVTLLDRVRDAIVITGSRAATAYGTNVATDYAAALVREGHTVMSGAAFGVEHAAVRGVLMAGGAPIVVLPCGVDRVYPTAHTDLIETTLRAGGLLVSLTEPGGAPSRERFIMRSAWMGAQAAATLVVEAAMRSGALKVAEAAAMVGRPVGAVPGPITSLASHGPHALIETGARIVYDDHTLLTFARRATRGPLDGGR